LFDVEGCTERDETGRIQDDERILDEEDAITRGHWRLGWCVECPGNRSGTGVAALTAVGPLLPRRCPLRPASRQIGRARRRARASRGSTTDRLMPHLICRRRSCTSQRQPTRHQHHCPSNSQHATHSHDHLSKHAARLPKWTPLLARLVRVLEVMGCCNEQKLSSRQKRRKPVIFTIKAGSNETQKCGNHT